METKTRKPLVAALLSFITPGLGQLYNGELKKGVFLYFFVFILFILSAMTGLQYHLYGYLTLIIGELLVSLLVSLEAFFRARKMKELTVRPYNKWSLYLLIVLLSFGVESVTARPISGIKSYGVGSGSMEPTLLTHEFVIADLKYYKANEAKTGDVIVFTFDDNPKRIYMKRIIATEGNVVESKNKVIYINGTALVEPYVVHNDSEIASGQNAIRDNFGPVTIQNGKLFMMGDNRDQSYDSRFRGFADKKNIKGKVLYILWSGQKNRIGTEIK